MRLKRAVSHKFVLSAVGIVVVVALAVHFLHQLQVDRNADVFRERAEAALEKGESGKAIASYKQYLGFRPDDTDARAALGILIEDNAQSARSLLQAYLTYEKVLLEEEDRDDIRLRLIDVAIRLRRFTDAESHIQRLLPTAANKAELEYKLGLCLEVRNELQQAAELYQSAIAAGYTQPPVFLQLADLFQRELNRGAEVVDLIDDMVKANPESVTALLARARLRISQQKFDEAREDLARAEACDPSNSETVLLESGIALENQTSEESLKTIREKLKLAIAEHPRESRLYERLSQLELTVGNRDAVVEILQSGIVAVESPAELLVLLGDVLISQGKAEEAKEQLDRLKEQDGPELFVDFLQARLHIADGNLPEALRLFRSVQPRVAKIPRLGELCSIYLASCYESMGDPDEQIVELQNALAINPQSEQTLLKLASAYQMKGKADMALEIYRRLSHVPSVALAIANIEFQRSLRQSPEQRDWSKVEEALRHTQTGSVGASLLQERMLMARGQQTEALELLQKLRSEAPTAEVLSRWALALMAQGQRTEASQAIDDAQKKLGDTVTLRITRAAWINEAGADQGDEALQNLESGSDVFSSDDQFRLFASLAQIHELRGHVATAQRLWQLALEKRPNDLQTRFRIIQLALASGDTNEAARQLAELRGIVGSESPHVWAAEAMMLINSGDAGQTQLDQARSLLAKVAARRPDWIQVPLTLAMIEELDGHADRACQNYRRAIELGDREPAHLNRAVALLSRLKRYDEVGQILALVHLDSPPAIRQLLQRMKAELALNQGDAATALTLADTAVPADSPNPRDQIWHAQMLAALGQMDQAEVAYRAAVELGPQDPDAWIALLRFLKGRDQQQAVDTEVIAAQKHLNDPGNPDVMARMYEAAGKIQEADQNYQQVLAGNPKNASVIQQVSEFYVRSNQDSKAEPLIRLLMDPGQGYRQAVVLQARRSLAGILAKRDYAGLQEAIGLLDTNIAAVNDATTDQFAKATILASRHHPGHLQDAMKILEGLDRQDHLSPPSRMLLAQVCDALGQKETADLHWRKLLGPNAASDHVAMYVSRQLKNGNLGDIPPLLEQLRKLNPNAGMELTFRWRVATGDVQGGIELLQGYVDEVESDAEAKAQRIFRVASMAEQMAVGLKRESDDRSLLLSASEKWFRDIMDDVPNVTPSLARVLGREGRVSEALTLCAASWEKQKDFDLSGIAMQLVRQPEATPEDVALVGQWLQTAVDTDANSLAGLIQLGEFGLYHERYQKSIEIYQNLLQQSSDQVVALNNLAWLLSMWKGDHAQAEELIERAIQRAGPIAPLLDTRGTIRLNSGKIELAVEDFRNASTLTDDGAYRFHLALAFWTRGSRLAAQLNLRQALDAGFKMEDQLPLDQQAWGDTLREMRESLESSDKTP